MTEVIPIFEKIVDGEGVAQSELWVDLGLIPSGIKIWVGFATYIAVDKSFSFELRTNDAGKSAGTSADTKLHDFSGATGGSSVDRDFHQFGSIIVQSVESTGVEHWWIRIRSKNNNAGDYGYIIYYTEY